MYRAYIKNLEDLELDYTDIPHEGHFIYGNLIQGGNQSNTDAIVGDLIEATDEYVNPEWWCSIEKGSAEQSTGIKDINGKDIYEGDLIMTHPEYASEEPKRGIVQYGSCRAEFSYEVRKGDHRSIWSSNKYRMYEVIGNVHENLDLLGAQHE